jgi:riboflavin kinase/FMN adenylyltransferase
MEIVRNLEKLRRDSNCIITTGTFDGVHRGHQSIIQILCENAKQIQGCTTIVTFEPHPQFVIKRDQKNELKLLTTIDEKIAIFESLAIDRLIILEFDEKFAQLNSHDFIESVLIQKIGFNRIIIGYDHAFGRDRQGNQKVLEELSKRYHFPITVVPPFSMAGTIISSTQIRRLLRDGDIEQATNFLGRDYQLTGSVIKGEGRGRTLDIPTANLEPNSSEKLIPGDGIYAVWAQLTDRWHKGVLYIGSRPTFSHKDRSIELHVFDFSGNLYGATITVKFKAKIRDDYQFDNIEALLKQIENDKKKTLAILSKDQ